MAAVEDEFVKHDLSLKWQLKFIAMMIFSGCLFLLKIFVGHFSNSIALVASSFHMISDFAALTIGFVALRVASKQSGRLSHESGKFTFGWVRAEVLGGLINTVFLFALCFSILIESLKKFIISEPISHPRPVLIVGCVSLLIDLVGLILFGKTREKVWSLCWPDRQKCGSQDDTMMDSLLSEDVCEGKTKVKPSQRRRKRIGITKSPSVTWEKEYQAPHDLNIRSVYLHILEHFLSSLIVIVSASIVLTVHGSWTVYVDPAMSVLVVIIIGYSMLPLFKESLMLFMQTVPANLKVKDMEEKLIAKIPEILSVHEFHVWQLGGEQVVASAHVLFRSSSDYEICSEQLKMFFQNEGIQCMTFQPEFADKDDQASLDSLRECYLPCSKERECVEYMCCDTTSALKEV